MAYLLYNKSSNKGILWLVEPLNPVTLSWRNSRWLRHQVHYRSTFVSDVIAILSRLTFAAIAAVLCAAATVKCRPNTRKSAAIWRRSSPKLRAARKTATRFNEFPFSWACWCCHWDCCCCATRSRISGTSWWILNLTWQPVKRRPFGVSTSVTSPHFWRWCWSTKCPTSMTN